jgi:hypothetical protein
MVSRKNLQQDRNNHRKHCKNSHGRQDEPRAQQKYPLMPRRPRTFAVGPSLGHPQNPAGDENHRDDGNCH